MKKARIRRMFIVLGILLVIVGVLVIWFNIPYSPVKKQFHNDIADLLTENQLSGDNEPFTEKNFHLCGWIFQ